MFFQLFFSQLTKQIKKKKIKVFVFEFFLRIDQVSFQKQLPISFFFHLKLPRTLKNIGGSLEYFYLFKQLSLLNLN